MQEKLNNEVEAPNDLAAEEAAENCKHLWRCC